jgi:50S ribosomal protein uL30
MIAIIRITGLVKMKESFEETLSRLRLRRKFVCVLVNEKDDIKMGMLNQVRNFVSFGKIEKGVLVQLIEKRGERIDNKEIKDADKLAEQIEAGKGLEDLGLKPFFRLNSPRHGLKSSKLHYPKGVLGENKEIGKLIERML